MKKHEAQKRIKFLEKEIYDNRVKRNKKEITDKDYAILEKDCRKQILKAREALK